MKRDDWWQAVWEAIFRVYDRNETHCFTRKELFDTEPLKRMVSTSRSKGQHPEMSVSYILTDFTRGGKYAQIKRTGHGKYELTDLGMYVVSTIKDHSRSKGQHPEMSVSYILDRMVEFWRRQESVGAFRSNTQTQS